MIYNELGNTGLKVSNLGFGASSLGGVFRNIDEKEAIQAVFTAVENGINFIDVSPYYGHLKAETVLGKALKDIPRDKFILSTKVGRYGKDGYLFQIDQPSHPLTGEITPFGPGIIEQGEPIPWITK